MEQFIALGKEIEEQWRRQNYDEAIFPALAAEALRVANIPSKLSGWDVIKWALDQNELPTQQDPAGRFGDPPITIFNAPRFYIDVYFWLEGTTATHQHAFCGAFQVLMGSSIHSWYEFERDDVINSFMELGSMNLRLCELLEIGGVQEINAGRQYIHSLFHLDQPSATIVVRTSKSPLHLPQFSYHKPHLAIDPFCEDPTLAKKIQAIHAMMRSNYEAADELISALLRDSDLQATYNLLSNLHGHSHGSRIDEMFALSNTKDRFGRFMDIALERHGARAERLKEVFEVSDRQNYIVRQRAVVTNPDHRFFLALLLNVDGRERIFALVRQRYPATDAADKVLDWLFDLSQTRVVGTAMQSVLDIPDFGDVDIAILEAVFAGKDDDAVFADITAQGSKMEADGFARRMDVLRSANLLRPLFA